MRHLLLFFLIAVQTTAFGYTNTSQQENNAQKTLTSEKCYLNTRSYHFFRYYSPESVTYVSQDPIGLSGRMPNMYSYVFDLNRQLDSLGLEIITEGSVFRGLNPKQSAYSPSSRDIGHYSKTGKMPGISTFDDVDTVKGINKKFKLGMDEALDIDVSKLGGGFSGRFRLSQWAC